MKSYALSFFSKFFFNICTTYFRIFEWLRVAFCYYPRDLRFLWVDLLLAVAYFLRSPHRISKNFLKNLGAENIYGFGETPLTTFHLIAKECRILSHDVVYELGCGSARTCFWLKIFVNCKVIGVDYLPTFIHKAKWINKCSSLNIDFIQEDMLQIDVRKATVIYLYGTCLEDAIIEKLILNFNNLCGGTKIITVSYPLTDYSSSFVVTKNFTARFPWGRADIFLNEKV